MSVLSFSTFTKMEQNKVIVIGGNHHNTLGVIRSLGYKGLKSHVVVVTDHRSPYVCYSKYVLRYQILPSAGKIVEYLLKIKDAYLIKPVIISCADFVTAELDSHQEQLSNYYHLPVGKGNIVQVMNKNTMAKIAIDCGFKIPKNVVLRDVKFSDGKMYILKPLRSIEGSKSDIVIVRSREELDKFLSSPHCNNLQIQEYIKKKLEFQLIGCSLHSGEEVIIPGASIILRQPENTNTGFLKYVGFNEFHYDKIEACKRFIQAIGYSGLFSMEFLRGSDEIDYFMEINLRNDGNSICVTAAGVNLPYIWYCSCLESEDWKNEASRTVRKTIVMPEFDDFVNVLKHRISLKQWIKDVQRTECFMEYDKTDTKPFYIGLRQQIINYLKLGFRKLCIIK